MGALLHLAARRGLDPGEPPYTRERLLALLEAGDAVDAGLPETGIGIREAQTVTGVAAIRRVEAFNAGDRFCLCGCGTKIEGKKQFAVGHHRRLRLLEERIEEGLLDPAILTPKLRRELRRLHVEKYYWQKGPEDEPEEDTRQHRHRPGVLNEWKRREREDGDP